MNSLCDQPYQYRQLRSQSLSPYNDFNLIKQLKRQLHYPPQKTPQLSSFEYMPNQEQIETNIIHSDSIQQYCKYIKSRKNSLILEANSNPINQIVGQSLESNQFNNVVPKIIVVKNLQQKLSTRKQKPLNPINPQDCNDDEIIHQTFLAPNSNNVSQAQTKRDIITILPQIKKSKLITPDEQPIKRSARYEQLMKKTCDEQLYELQSLIKKMQKQPVVKKEKKVTFLI